MRRSVGIAIGFVILASPAWGHRPTSFDADEVVSDPTISWTIPGRFETGEEIFSFTLEYDSPFAAPFEILVPTANGNGDFRPRYAIVGPGLPEPTAAILEDLPAEAVVENGDGVFYEPNADADRFLYFEGVMRRALVSSGSTAVVLHEGLSTIWDWYATFASIAGVSDVTDKAAAEAGLPPIDSLDLWPYISGAVSSSPRKQLLVGTGNGDVNAVVVNINDTQLMWFS